MIKLQHRGKPDQYVNLTATSLTVGRDPSNGWCIDDPSISDFHAEISVDHEDIYVIDLVSASGTYVNNERLRGRRKLKAWDVLKLGSIELEVNDPRTPQERDWVLRGHTDLLANQYFALGQNTVIGRDPECDVTIDDGQLSRRHALIEVNGSSVTIRDLDSANGTFVNGNQIQQSPLHPDDQVQLGSRRYVLVPPAHFNQGRQTRDQDATELSPRRKLQPDTYRDPPTEQLKTPAKHFFLQEVGDLLQMDDFELTVSPCRIGRSEQLDLVLTDPSVSRHHATITLQDGSWQLLDAESINRVVVNGMRVTNHQLQNGDVIVLGRVQLKFQERLLSPE